MRLADSCVASCFNMHSFWCFPGAGIPGRKGAKLLRRHERERSGIQLAFWRHVPTRNFGIPSHPYHCYQCWPIACFLLVGWRDVWFHAYFLTSFLFHLISSQFQFHCFCLFAQHSTNSEVLWTAMNCVSLAWWIYPKKRDSQVLRFLCCFLFHRITNGRLQGYKGATFESKRP